MTQRAIRTRNSTTLPCPAKSATTTTYPAAIEEHNKCVTALSAGFCSACVSAHGHSSPVRAICLKRIRQLKKGDLYAAQINPRNAVRADPQNAEAHYDLAQVSFGLGAVEREAEQALERGFDPHLVVRLLAQGLIAQGKFDTLLQKLQPGGKDTSRAETILVFRGYAQIGLRQFDAAQKSFVAAAWNSPSTSRRRRPTTSSGSWK